STPSGHIWVSYLTLGWPAPRRCRRLGQAALGSPMRRHAPSLKTDRPAHTACAPRSWRAHSRRERMGHNEPWRQAVALDRSSSTTHVRTLMESKVFAPVCSPCLTVLDLRHDPLG